MKNGWRFQFDGLVVTVFNSGNLWHATRLAAKEARHAGILPLVLKTEKIG